MASSVFVRHRLFLSCNCHGVTDRTCKQKSWLKCACFLYKIHVTLQCILVSALFLKPFLYFNILSIIWQLTVKWRHLFSCEVKTRPIYGMETEYIIRKWLVLKFHGSGHLYIKFNYVICLSDSGSSCHVTVMGSLIVLVNKRADWNVPVSYIKYIKEVNF
jgi:hypothetical protein